MLVHAFVGNKLHNEWLDAGLDGAHLRVKRCPGFCREWEVLEKPLK